MDSEKIELLMKNITKTFPGGVIALRDVSVRLTGGEFTALVGENGAGKSTLMKILYGIYTYDKGEILLNGKPLLIRKPSDAIRNGIIMVSQSPQLIDRLTVAENLTLGLEGVRLLSGFSNAVKLVREYSEKIGVKIKPEDRVWSLTYTQKQLVEIVRALILGAKILILDEALTYLPIEERKRFYTFLQEFKQKGGTVVVITHKIPEALEVADRIIVLRKGSVSGELTRENATLDKVRELMFAEAAKEISYDRLPTSVIGEKIVIEAKDVWVEGDYGVPVVKGVSIRVREGEVAGIAGVVGNGQREFLEAIVGLRKISKGKIFVEGVETTNNEMGKTRSMGIGFIPDLPLRFGISQDNSILENIAALFEGKNLLVDWERVRSLTREIIKTFNVLTPSEEAPVKILSGGNLMKVIVGRELNYSRKALIAYNPTRALDEITAVQVRRIIKNKSIREKIAVLFASEDLDEVYQLSDTIYVMNSGKLHGPFDPEKTPREDIEKLMVM
ncbi:MAG: ATP-binding cassette domain-containing protein [Thermosphaera sp.]